MHSYQVLFWDAETESISKGLVRINDPFLRELEIWSVDEDDVVSAMTRHVSYDLLRDQPTLTVPSTPLSQVSNKCVYVLTFVFFSSVFLIPILINRNSDLVCYFSISFKFRQLNQIDKLSCFCTVYH
jgi:hypothetical protein